MNREQAVDREINKRRQVIELLNHGSKYYESLLGEANIVANVSLDRKKLTKIPRIKYDFLKCWMYEFFFPFLLHELRKALRDYPLMMFSMSKS